MKVPAAVLLFTISLFEQRHPGSPLDYLPKSMPVLTHSGERAAISKKQLKSSWSETLAHCRRRPCVCQRRLHHRQQNVVFASKNPSCVAQSQDVYDNDQKLTFSCYRPRGLGGQYGSREIAI